MTNDVVDYKSADPEMNKEGHGDVIPAITIDQNHVASDAGLVPKKSLQRGILLLGSLLIYTSAFNLVVLGNALNADLSALIGLAAYADDANGAALRLGGTIAINAAVSLLFQTALQAAACGLLFETRACVLVRFLGESWQTSLGVFAL
jgi:hypothetical protein